MDQPVVRHRLAKCGAALEAQWAWTESFVYSMVKLPKKDADVELGGLTAAAKAQAGVVLMECAQCAVLLFGGNGFTRSGQGEIAESKLLFKTFEKPQLLTVNRTVERGTWQSHPWWKRRCLVRSVNQATGQELSEQDQDARKTSWIFEAVECRHSASSVFEHMRYCC